MIGAAGFVGRGFCRHLRGEPGLDLVEVVRESYSRHRGATSDVVIDCAGNSKKYLAEEDPAEDFEQTVAHRLRTLRDFPAALQIHVSSVDVYDRLDDPDHTREATPLRLPAPSRYGFHKRLAEQLVMQYAPSWLVLRLAGMVGDGLRKNPVFDIMSGQPLWIHPDSQYQFLSTHDVARIAWQLAASGVRSEVFNVCGRGLISPREIAVLAGRSLDLSRLRATARPRVVNASIEKLAKLTSVPDTTAAVTRYLGHART